MFKKKFGWIIIIIGFGALVFGCVALYSYFEITNLPYLSIRKNSESWGQFGDYLGGVLNPAFSFLALLVLLWTLHLQNESLNDASKSNNEQKELLERQLNESVTYSKEQKKLLELQLFENTFYNLLNYHKGIVDSNEEWDDAILLKGKDCFKIYYNKYIKGGYVLPGGKMGVTVEQNSLEKFKEFNEEYSYKIGHYFRILYRIFKFISESGLCDDTKYFYSGIVRGQLSSYELLVLFINCLTDDGARFKEYARDYALFENMPLNCIKEVAPFLKEYGSVEEAQKYFGDNIKMRDYHSGTFFNSGNDLSAFKA